MHPLAVAPSHQRRGVGRGLVGALESRVRGRGGCVVYLGTDDVDGVTAGARLGSLGSIARVIARLNRGRTGQGVSHPYRFYRRMGYSVCGIIPDANGPGRPDILMCKRIDAGPESRAPIRLPLA